MQTEKTPFHLRGNKYIFAAGILEYALGFVFALFLGLSFVKWFNWENIQTYFQSAPAQTIFQLSWMAFGFVTCGSALIGGVCAITKKHYKVALFGAWLMTFWLSWTTIVEFINALASQFAIWQYVLSAVTFAVVTISPSLISLVLIAASKQTFFPRLANSPTPVLKPI